MGKDKKKGIKGNVFKVAGAKSLKKTKAKAVNLGLKNRGSKMAERFSDSQMLKLVEIYRDYECLWNVTSALYKNHDARQSAYKQIAEKLNISGISDKDIPKKIKNLRSSYYQELKKIEKSIRSGSDRDSVYKPKVSWFSIADGILRAFKNKEKTFSNIDENSGIATDTVDFENNNTVLEENDREENSNAADEIIENRVQELTETSSSTSTVPSKLATKKRGKSNKRQDELKQKVVDIDKEFLDIKNNPKPKQETVKPVSKPVQKKKDKNVTKEEVATAADQIVKMDI
ncbi:uncharacterized protein LOC125070772 [Vanessa atalanta]|uniref:uncharacterized protein LOC125070772 n=1 Tax=Vanessa atalanta TaxID=42275 RepID=UPI001FCDAE45|nr:uncharacterized protein LOC125070772 [Vanessa atalanta]